MKIKRSFKKMLISRGPNVKPCGTPVVILSRSLNVLFTLVNVLFTYLLYCISERLFQTHMLLTWQSINHNLMCQRPLKGP